MRARAGTGIGQAPGLWPAGRLRPAARRARARRPVFGRRAGRGRRGLTAAERARVPARGGVRLRRAGGWRGTGRSASAAHSCCHGYVGTVLVLISAGVRVVIAVASCRQWTESVVPACARVLLDATTLEVKSYCRKAETQRGTSLFPAMFQALLLAVAFICRFDNPHLHVCFFPLTPLMFPFDRDSRISSQGALSLFAETVEFLCCQSPVALSISTRLPRTELKKIGCSSSFFTTASSFEVNTESLISPMKNPRHLRSSDLVHYILLGCDYINNRK